VLPDAPLIIVTGKGGVGRSAVTAAIARVRAREGARVLTMSMGSGSGLASHLGLDRLLPKPQRGDEGVAALAIDPAAALKEYLKLRSLPPRLAGRIFGVLVQTVPGVRDVVVVGKLVHESTLPSWDAVVVDAHPIGQILSSLLAPSVVEELVPEGRIHHQAASLRKTLADPARVGIVVVATPAELAFSEAGTFIELAAESGLTPAISLVVNRVLSSPGFTSVPLEPGPSSDAARLHLELLSAQERLLPPAPVAERLDFIFGSDDPVLVADCLADGLAS